MGITYAAGVCGSCLDMVNSLTKQHVAQRERDALAQKKRPCGRFSCAIYSD